MFENDQTIVNTLLATDANFRRLFEKHRTLKSRVTEANSGTMAIDEFELEKLKKQKLLLKDEMAGIINRYRHARAAPVH